MKYMVNRRNAVRLTTAAGVSAIFAGAGTAAQAATPNAKRNSLDLALDTFFGGHQSLQPAHSGGSQAAAKPKTKYRTADEHLDAILEKLLQVPDYLQRADPKTYPNFEAELDKYLDGITVLNPRDYGYDTEKVNSTLDHTTSKSDKPDRAVAKLDTLDGSTSKAEPAFDLWGCIAAVAALVAEYGLPVMKVIGWIRKGKELYGSVAGLARAIKSGQIFKDPVEDIGEDGAKLLEALLGLDGVKTACFS